MVKKNIFNAIALIAGTAIGAGFLGMPYVVAKAGFFLGLFYLVLIGLFVLFIQLCMGEVILRTKGNNHFAGYAGKYLGNDARNFIFIIMALYIFSALVAYLVASGQSLSMVFFGNLNYALYMSLAFWALMSCLTFIGLRALKHFGKLGFFIILIFVSIISFLFGNTIVLENLTYVNFEEIFLPVGVILFSFFSFSAMPAVQRLLLGREKLMKKSIIIGSLVPFFVYLIFVLVLIGNFGQNVDPIATLSLGRYFALLGVFAIFTSFLSLSISIRDLLRFDFKMKRFLSWFICAIVPLGIFLVIHFLNLVSFIQLLSLAGVLAGGIIGIFILFLNLEAKKKGKRVPEYVIPLNFKLVVILAVLFALGIIFELLRKLG